MRIASNLAAGVLIAVCFAANAVAADPLYLQRPYDEVLLDENNGNARLKVQPLKLPGRKMPAAEDRTQDLEIELVDRPGEKFLVSWNFVTGIRFFEEMVLAEAEQLVKGEQFDEAYPYYQFLESNYPQSRGLKESAESYLWASIGSDYKAGRYEQALPLLIELYGRNPERQGLSTAFERVSGKLAEARLAAGNYRAARGLLKSLGERFPATKETTVAPLEAQLQEKAGALVSQAQADAAAGKLREAQQAVKSALDIWPALAGGRELAALIHQQHPVVVVGVTSPLPAAPMPGDWAQDRTSRLVAPPLFEAIAGETPSYRSRLVESAANADPRRLLLKIKPQANAAGGLALLTPHDLAFWFALLADRQHPTFDAALADVISAVEVQGEDAVKIEFHQPVPRPEAWLSFPLSLPGGGPAPYALDAQSAAKDIFVRQPAGASSMPAEIVERAFDDSAAAIRALRRGEISVIDRVSPWDLKRLAGASDVVVEPYAWATVHLLVPSPRRPQMASRTLRRAILYGIDREAILRRSLLGGQAIAGCEVLSGPLPRGTSKDDPHGYAYDETVEPRAYDPVLATGLVGLTREPSNSADVPLVLAHPADPLARVACQCIARQLAAVGLAVTLRESGEPVKNDDYDLVYVELPMREPIVDAWRLLGPHGMTGDCSPAMLAALRDLTAAGDWNKAVERLHAVHRITAAELPVLPLWQTIDHLAYHTSVKGIGQMPASLYQNVEQWQVELRLPTE